MTAFCCKVDYTHKRTGRIVSRRRAIRRPIRFPSWLHPDDRVDVSRSGIRRRASAEARPFDVAPVAPLLAEVLLTRTALIYDEVSIETGGSQKGSKRLKQ